MTTVTKAGSEILVNTAVRGNQRLEQITTLANGDFVVTWQDSSAGIDGATGDSSSFAIKAQVFAAAGDKIGSEILVNTATTNGQEAPQITALSNGGFVVTWEDNSHGIGGATGDSLDTAVKAQVFTAAGDKAGSEILVNTTAAGSQQEPKIATLQDGGFVVTWSGGGDGSRSAIKAQVFDASGDKIGSEIPVNTATHYIQYAPQIAELSNGGFVVTWTDWSAGVGGATGDNSERAVKAQVFTAAGDKIGTEILVNTATQSFQIGQEITALANGGFVVTWMDDREGAGGATGDSSDSAIKAQVFTAAGEKTGSEILVNTATQFNQASAEITALANGGFVVTWGDGSPSVIGEPDSDIKAQVFTAAGDKVGSEILVNTATESLQQEPEITALPNGGFLVTWIDHSEGVGGATGDNSTWAVKAQAFTATGDRIGSEILINTAVANSQFDQHVAVLTDRSFVVTWRDSSLGAGGATGDTAGEAIKTQVFAIIDDPTGVTITGTAQADAIDAVSAPPGQPTPTIHADTITGLGGDDTIHSLGGDDAIAGGGGIDMLYGDDGHDMLNGGTGADTMHGGAGDDTYIVVDVGDTATESADEGTDLVRSFASFMLGENVENLTLKGSDDIDGRGNAMDNRLVGNDGANTLFGLAGDDTIRGFGGDDIISGGDGHDTLYGDDGNDTLNGRSGVDKMLGATGDDTYVVDDASDTVIESADEGTDLVGSFVTFTLGDNLENLTLKGSDDIDGRGNTMDNRLIGNDGANTLFGLAGNDTLNGGRGADVMRGGTGDDHYIVDDANDAVIENPGEGTDRIAAWADFTLGAGVENLILKGDDDLNGTGNALDNKVFGNDGNNILNGGTGSDLAAGKGVDILRGGAGNDRFVFGALRDTLAGDRRDAIRDFQIGADKIDLRGIDADTTLAGDQAFAFIGSNEFTGTAGELQAKVYGPNTIVGGDVDGNGRADFQILVNGHAALQESDFLR